MRTFMIVKKNAAGEIVEIAGPCIEADLFFDDGLEHVDEIIFKTLYPDAYRKKVLENLVDATACWIEKLYGDTKRFVIENGSIVTNEFIIQITPCELHIMIYPNCPPVEAANLILHLKTCILEEIPLIITEIPLFCTKFCEN